MNFHYKRLGNFGQHCRALSFTLAQQGFCGAATSGGGAWMATEAQPSGLAGSNGTSGFRPIAKQTPNQDDLSDVVRIVVGEQKRFPKNGLPGAVGNLGG